MITMITMFNTCVGIGRKRHKLAVFGTGILLGSLWLNSPCHAQAVGTTSVEATETSPATEDVEDVDVASDLADHLAALNTAQPATPMPSEEAPCVSPTTPRPQSGMERGPFSQSESNPAPNFGRLAAGLASAQGNLAAAASAPGYIDLAVPVTRIREQFNATYNNNQVVDKALYLYPATQGNGGYPNLPLNINAQTYSTYLEFATSNRFSAFCNIPIARLDITGLNTLNNFTFGQSVTGLANIDAGFKYAIIARPDRYVTFQLRVYAPTGNPINALGNGIFSIEPSLLFWCQRTSRLTTFGQLTLWAPAFAGAPTAFDPASFLQQQIAGQVFQYGVGAAYAVYQNPAASQRLSVINEVMGWTILSGQGTTFDPTNTTNFIAIVPVAGETIINYKLGLRYTAGRHSIYAGWGHTLTGDYWYRNLARADYTLFF